MTDDELDDIEIVKEITPRLQQQEQNIPWEEGLRQMNDGIPKHEFITEEGSSGYVYTACWRCSLDEEDVTRTGAECAKRRPTGYKIVQLDYFKQNGRI